MSKETAPRLPTPTAILVALVDPVATVCSDALSEAGLRVLRVGHLAAACERIPVVMPLLVVVSSTLSAADGEMLADRCIAVGADVFTLPSGDQDLTALRDRLKAAGDMAIVRSQQRPG